MVSKKSAAMRQGVYTPARWISPPAVKVGDTVGLVAPASAPADAALIDRAVEQLGKLGFRVLLGFNLRSRYGYLAGQDEERLGDLHDMYVDPDVRAIFCLRGGYGTTRLLPHLDYKLIRAHPKALIGYSDITALQLALLKYSGVRSYHGPVVAELCREGFPESATKRLVEALRGKTKKVSLCDLYPESRDSIEILVPGQARGFLVGGNLALWAALVGTGYLPSLRGGIVFFEEVNEAPYRIDRMLTTLLHAGVFKGVRGIAIGSCRDCVEVGKQEYWQTPPEIFRERLQHLQVPIVFGLPFGHAGVNLTLQQGGLGILDGRAGDLMVAGVA